jgi:hypothetical protein
MKSLRLLFVLLAVIAGLPYAVASTIRVPKDQPTIQAGINAANLQGEHQVQWQGDNRQE